MDKVKKAIKKNWDEISIATALGHFYINGKNIDMEEYGYIIEALRRSRNDLNEADVTELQSYVQSLEDEQLPGLISNIKGIAHEVYYVEAENEDGDTVMAYIFEETNHATYDVVLFDDSGPISQLQLKATDSVSYAKEAIANVGSDQVVLTSELAQKLGVQSSGISNDSITSDVEFIVDQLLEDKSLWDYLPLLSAWSVALIAASLTKRYIKKQIDRATYIQLITIYCGAKTTKIAIIIALLSIPGINVVTGALLIIRTGLNLKRTFS